MYCNTASFYNCFRFNKSFSKTVKLRACSKIVRLHLGLR